MVRGNQRRASTCSTAYARQVGEAWKANQIENLVPKTECGTNVGPTRRPFPFRRRAERALIPQDCPTARLRLAPVSIRSGQVHLAGSLTGRPFLADRSMSGLSNPACAHTC